MSKLWMAGVAVGVGFAGVDGRGQDVGFQKAIDNSPRRRHHVRFWALSLERTEAMLGQVSFWLNDDRPADHDEVFWVGAGTKDTGFSLTRLTFQVTHATDSDTNAERNFIIVSTHEANSTANKLSDQSPVGKALLGHKEGDRVEVSLPNGNTATYTIKTIK